MSIEVIVHVCVVHHLLERDIYVQYIGPYGVLVSGSFFVRLSVACNVPYSVLCSVYFVVYSLVCRVVCLVLQSHSRHAGSCLI